MFHCTVRYQQLIPLIRRVQPFCTVQQCAARYSEPIPCVASVCLTVAGSATNGVESRGGPGDPSAERFGPGAGTEQEPGATGAPGTAGARAAVPAPPSSSRDATAAGGVGPDPSVPPFGLPPQTGMPIPSAETGLGAAGSGARGDAPLAASDHSGPGQGQPQSSDKEVRGSTQLHCPALCWPALHCSAGHCVSSALHRTV